MRIWTFYDLPPKAGFNWRGPAAELLRSYVGVRLRVRLTLALPLTLTLTLTLALTLTLTLPLTLTVTLARTLTRRYVGAESMEGVAGGF
jgi:hypothetical protein